ncbi:MAG: radical SAM protein [Phycisphaeraceae bacterium]
MSSERASSSALERVYSHHPRQWRSFRVVYPVISRRAGGLSVGVNLTPEGTCNFDCTYCSVDREKVKDQAPVDLDELHAELSVMLGLVTSGALWSDPDFADVPADHRVLHDVAFSGDGEPTASPLFEAAVEMVLELHEQYGLGLAKVVVITNGTLLHRESVKRALDLLGDRGEVWAKLDAGTEAYYQRVDRSAVPFERVVENLVGVSRRRAITVQTMLLRDRGGPMPDREFLAYLDRLRMVVDRGGVIERVQLYTVARDCREPDVAALSLEELEMRAGQVREVLPGLEVLVYAGV